MKITVAAGIYPPDIGGPARYARMIETELPKHGFEITVVPFRVVRHLPKVVRHIAYTYQLWRNTADSEAVYALDPISVGLSAYIVSRLRRVPLLVRLGGDYAWEQGVQRYGVIDTLDDYTAGLHRRPWMVQVLASIQTFVVRRAVLVIVPSKYLASIVQSWGIIESRLKVIYSAHSVEAVLPNRETLRDTYSFSDFTIVSVSRLIPWKGMHTLIRLVRRRADEGKLTSLVIGGDGPERHALEVLAETLGVSESVRFIGALSMEDVFKVVVAGDVFMLDTRYEGLSHHLIEAMALGTPVVTTPVGGNPELITPELNGIFVTPGDVTGYDDALTRLQNDQSFRLAMVHQARKRAASFAAHDAVLVLADELRRALL